MPSMPAKPLGLVSAARSKWPPCLASKRRKRGRIIGKRCEARRLLAISLDIGFDEILPRARIGRRIPAAGKEIDMPGLRRIPKPRAEQMRMLAVETGLRQLIGDERQIAAAFGQEEALDLVALGSQRRSPPFRCHAGRDRSSR